METNESLSRSAQLVISTDGGEINQADADRIAKEAVRTIISELPEDIQTLAVIRYVIKRCEVILEQVKCPCLIDDWKR